MINPFIIIKNWIRRKIAEFLYPEISELSDLDFQKTKKYLEERYGKIEL